MTFVYPDPLPFRLRVLRALTAALKEITPDNGYVFDLADFDPGDGQPKERVQRGRDIFGDEDPLPLVGILEAVTPADFVAEPPPDTTAGEHDWLLLLQGWVSNDPAHPTDPAYVLLADVRRRLAAEKVRKNADRDPDILGLGEGRNRITALSLPMGVTRPPDHLSPHAYFWLPLTLRVVENAAEPYS